MSNLEDPEFRPSWANRRRTIFGALIFCAATLAALLVGWFMGIDGNATTVTIAGGVIFCATAVIASYVFNATWEDIRLWKP